jgi:hypothetical protein
VNAIRKATGEEPKEKSRRRKGQGRVGNVESAQTDFKEGGASKGGQGREYANEI